MIQEGTGIIRFPRTDCLIPLRAAPVRITGTGSCGRGIREEQCYIPAMHWFSRACLFTFLSITILSAAPQTPFSSAPFTACKSDGQVGSLPAPTHANIAVQVDASAAPRLSYYKAQNGPGVLGPRGWSCFEIYGSSGGSCDSHHSATRTGKLTAP